MLLSSANVWQLSFAKIILIILSQCERQILIIIRMFSIINLCVKGRMSVSSFVCLFVMHLKSVHSKNIDFFLNPLKRFRRCHKVFKWVTPLKETVTKSIKLKRVLPLDTPEEPSLRNLFKFRKKLWKGFVGKKRTLGVL